MLLQQLRVLDGRRKVKRVTVEVSYLVDDETDQAQAGVELARFAHALGQKWTKARNVVVNKRGETPWPPELRSTSTST